MDLRIKCNEAICLWFQKPGPENTMLVLRAAKERAEQLGIKRVVVATSSGKTAIDALAIFPPRLRLIAISQVTGFERPNYQQMSDHARRELESNGVNVLTCQHAFGGIGRAIRNKLGTYQADEIIAYTLRRFGEGTKVAIEISLMAADAGLVRTDEDIVAIGGTSHGADTALVIQPANSFHFFDLKVRQVICKPQL